MHIRVPRWGGAEKIALAEKRSEIAAEADAIQRHRYEQHVRKAWMQRQFAQLPAMRREPSFAIERTQPRQEFTRLRNRSRWRRSQPGQFRGIRGTPLGRIEQERREIGIQNFRRAARRQRLVLLLGPEPI